MRLGDLDALFKHFYASADGRRYQLRDCDNFPETVNLEEVQKAIRRAPTVDAVPVVHGEWIPFEEQYFFTIFDGIQCSVCGSKHNTELAREYKYCPNCGAKMDKGDTPCQP